MPDNRICRRRILSEEYRDFIVSSRRIPPDISVPEEQLCRQTTEAGYDVVYVEQSQAEPLEFGRFTYGSVPRCYALLDMAAMEQAGVTAVQNYPDPGTDGGTGDDRVRGHRDRLHPPPAFRNLDGSTRIEGLWDQTQQDGDPPEGLSYGTGYSREEIDRALASGDPYAVVPSRDEDGHGTYIASLAAGSAGEEEQFLGAAPEAVIAAVRLKGAKQYLREFYCIAPGRRLLPGERHHAGDPVPGGSGPEAGPSPLCCASPSAVPWAGTTGRHRSPLRWNTMPPV